MEYTLDQLKAIADKVGYPNAEHFNRLFKKKFGITPLQFRNKKQGVVS